MRMFGGFNPGRAMLKIDRSMENLAHVPVVCEQCSNPMCLKSCPVGAISRDEQTRAVVIDKQKCVGCGICAGYCPLGMIHLDHDTGKAFKCDLCGGDPQCVKACPTQALEFLSQT